MDRFRLWLLTLLLAVSVIFMIRFSSILEIFLFSIGLAYVLMPAVNGVEALFLRKSKRGSMKDAPTSSKGMRGLAVLLVTLCVVLFIVVLAGLIIPYLSSQIANLISDFPAIHAGLQHWLGIVKAQLEQMNIPTELTEPVSNFFNELDSYLVDIAVSIITWLAQISSGILDVVIIFILQIYFLMDGPRIIQLGRDYLLRNRLHRVAGFLRTSTKIIHRYLKTQVLLSGSMAIVAFIGMKVIGVQYAGLFALMLFVVDFIPYIGPIAGTLVVIIFTLVTAGLKTAVFVGIFLLVLQQLEGNVLAPKVQGKTVGVHAAVIMLSLLVCFELWGPIGMLFSVLLAGMMKILLADILEYLLHPEITLGAFLSSGYLEEQETVSPAAPLDEETSETAEEQEPITSE